jgi:signal transduction histidine kinase
MIAWDDVALVVSVAAATAAVGVLVGRLVLRNLRQRPLRYALAVVALTSAMVTAVAVSTIGALMLVSGHALVVLIAAVVAGALAGLAVAMALGRALMRGSDALHDALGRLGGGQAPRAEGRDIDGAELAALAADLDEAHRKLVDAQSRERALEASRRELVAWVSHDLRTPLAGLRAMAEALEDGVVTDEATVLEYHRRMLAEVERLSGMIDDLFELSTINAGALRLTLASVDVSALVTDVVAASAPLADGKQIRVVVDTGVGTCAVADGRQLTRVLQNLLVNAIRYTPADGTVTVSTRAGDTGPVVVVGDECGGIPEDDLPRLFEVGFRGSRARSPGDGSGAGLGLAIASGIMHAHHGRVSVSNVPGGCRFEVQLPDASGVAGWPRAVGS